MKRDHLEFFINIEFLEWVDSPFCVEHSGEFLKRKYDHKLSYDNSMYVLGSLFQKELHVVATNYAHMT